MPSASANTSYSSKYYFNFLHINFILRNLSGPNTIAAAAPKPEIPAKLVDEFVSQPKNYKIMGALHNPTAFEAALAKWKELPVLQAEDIIRNSSLPIDYHMRVSENDIHTGFGQVDRDGKLQGIGRECHDFIYEGQFKDNVYHGWGRYINDQGVYWGDFHQGMRHGRGKYLSNDGKVMEGNWNMG